MEDMFGLPIQDPLDDLERSIEQPVLPGMDAYIEPLARSLDQVECNIESQHTSGPDLPFQLSDPLHGVLDQLESVIEQEIVPGSKSKSSEIEENPQPLTQEDSIPQMKAGPMSKPPVLNTEGLSFIKKYPHPIRRMGGGRTGIRNDGGGSECYCYLHEGWIRAEDCQSCADFEQTENQTDEGEEYCRHSSQYGDDV